MVRLFPNQPLILLVHVYYCPNTITGTLSTQCLHLYNDCRSPTHKLFQYLSVTCPNINKETQLTTTPHDNLDFLIIPIIPIIHFSQSMIATPTVATLYINGLNNQLVHQRFDHRSIEMIINETTKYAE